MSVIQFRRGAFRRILISRVCGGWQCALVLWDNSPDKARRPSRVYPSFHEALASAEEFRARSGLPIDSRAVDAWLATRSHDFNRGMAGAQSDDRPAA